MPDKFYLEACHYYLFSTTNPTYVLTWSIYVCTFKVQSGTGKREILKVVVAALRSWQKRWEWHPSVYNYVPFSNHGPVGRFTTCICRQGILQEWWQCDCCSTGMRGHLKSKVYTTRPTKTRIREECVRLNGHHLMDIVSRTWIFFLLGHLIPCNLLSVLKRPPWSRGKVHTSWPEWRGFKPGGGRRIFKDGKIQGTESSGRDFKPFDPCSIFTAL
jgi:hypothetical protein